MYIYIHVFYLSSKHPGFTSLTIRDSDLSKTKGWFKKTFGWGYDHAKGRNKSNREETIQWFQYIYIIYIYVHMVVTAPASKISSTMFSRSVAWPALLLPFWRIEAWWQLVTWGNQDYGGDSSSVQLRTVQQICGTAGAFAAILAHGSVVTWGTQDYGGDSSSVQDQLKNVQQICGTAGAFATWKRLWHGASKTMVATAPASSSRNVRQICGTAGAFAAILAHGSVVTWGTQDYGGDSSSVQDQLKNVQQICGTAGAFATWKRCDMGQARLWWWQLQRPAQECPADLWHGRCFCCNSGRWSRSDLGQSGPWWWQLQSPRSAQECSADLWHGRCFCCHFGT